MARRNFTQTSLATKLGHNQQFLSRRLSGKVEFDLADLGKIADALGVTLADLVDGEKASA